MRVAALCFGLTAAMQLHLDISKHNKTKHHAMSEAHKVKHNASHHASHKVVHRHHEHFTVNMSNLQKLYHARNKAAANQSMGLDPHCHSGIMNGAMTACCQADCGECSDSSDICENQATNGRGSTCCPATMLGGDLPSCEVSKAPCAVPESVRAPESVSELTAADRHAKDDCNEAIPKTSAILHLSTAYLKFPDSTVPRSVSQSCGTSYGELEQIAAACSDDDDCLGFSANSDGSPKCLLMAPDDFVEVSDSSDHLYLKKQVGYSGHTFSISEAQYSDCSKSCGSGTLSVKHVCESSEGVTVKKSFCSYLIAMNEDARPRHDHTVTCNSQPCDEATTMPGNCAEHLEGCVEALNTYSNNWYYDGEKIGAWGKFLLCPSGLYNKYPWWRNWDNREWGTDVEEQGAKIVITGREEYYYGYDSDTGLYFGEYRPTDEGLQEISVEFECGELNEQGDGEWYLKSSEGYNEKSTFYSFFSDREYAYYNYYFSKWEAAIKHPCACGKK